MTMRIRPVSVSIIRESLIGREYRQNFVRLDSPIVPKLWGTPDYRRPTGLVDELRRIEDERIKKALARIERLS